MVARSTKGKRPLKPGASAVVHAEASSSAEAPGPVASTSSAIILDLNAPAPSARPRKSAKSKGKGKATSTSSVTRSRRESDSEVKTCEAIDRWDEACDEVVVGGLKGKVARSWCLIHEAEEQNVRDEFHRCINGLIDAARSSALPSNADVRASVSLEELEAWEVVARERAGFYGMALKCIEYHLKHFEAAGDLTESLPKGLAPAELALRAKKAELVVRLIIIRSHHLILQSEDALWLLDPPPPPPPPCGALNAPSALGAAPPSSTTALANKSEVNSPLRPPLPPTLPTESEQPSPLLALEAQERSSLLELLSLTGSHASFIREGKKSVERVRIVECLFRRLISRDEELLVKAYRGGHDHVLRFFEDPQLCSLPALQRLHTALLATSAVSLKEAIMDAFRAIAWEESGAGETEEGEEGVGLQLLGGWVYKVQLSRSMGGREWGHLYDLCGCPGCILRCCMRFQDWAMTRRLTVIPSSSNGGATPSATTIGGPPPFEQWGDPTESDSNRIMRAIDVVRCAESGVGASEPEIRRVAGQLLGGKGKGVWVERVERNWMFVKISITHPRALPLLTALSKTFTLLVRSRLTPSHALPLYPIPPPSHLWYSRHRSAPSKPHLRHQAWATDPDGFGPGNSIPAKVLGALDALESPEKLQGMPPWEEVYEVLILDGWGHEGEGTGYTAGEAVSRSYERFEAEVGQVMCEGGIGVNDVKGAIEWGARESYRRGDLLWEFGGGEGRRKKKVDVRELVKGAFRDAGVDTSKVELEVQDERTDGNGKGKELESSVAAGVLNSLRDDALAFKLSRSLFR